MGVNKENDVARAKRFAEIYVYSHPGNITQSYAELEQEFPGTSCPITSDSVSALRKRAYKYFKRQEVKDAVKAERAKAQEVYDVRKDEIVANLQRIAFDEDGNTKNRLQALKQLSDLGGLTQQNIKLDATHDIEVVIE